ncbi:UV DNA damage endonuclease, partial [Phenoliferia sp. Uapishka_3]
MSVSPKVKTVAESVQRAFDSIKTSVSRPRRGAAAVATAANASLAIDDDADYQDVKGEEDYAEEEDSVPEKSPRKARRKKTDPPIVYVIPPVETLETTYKGRLGYACLNTILRNDLKPSVFCSRTCRIDTIKKEGMEHLKELGRKNMEDLTKLIEWNVAHSIFFLRMSSEMFPFASHAEYQYSLEYADKELKLAGDTAKRLGVRLTTHPGQFTQLGSPRKVVLENAVRDLSYHCEMMDRMGLDKDSVMIIHGGGVYGDKEAALERFKVNFRLLPEKIRNRIVLENDEICYSADDLLPVCEELDIPFVFDDLRPPVEQETTQTAGRKSSKRKQAPAEEPEFSQQVDENGEPIDLPATPTPKKRKSAKKLPVPEDVKVEGEQPIEEGNPTLVTDAKPTPKKRKSPAKKSKGTEETPLVPENGAEDDVKPPAIDLKPTPKKRKSPTKRVKVIKETPLVPENGEAAMDEDVKPPTVDLKAIPKKRRSPKKKLPAVASAEPEAVEQKEVKNEGAEHEIVEHQGGNAELGDILEKLET